MAASGVALVAIDTPSDPTPDLEPMVAVADLVVIPVRPDPADLEIVGTAVDLAEGLGKPFVFVITRSNQGDELPAATVIALAQYGTVCPVILPERPEFAACQGEGNLVGDLEPPSPAGEDIGRLWDYLAEHADRAAQRKAPPDRRHAPRQPHDQIATFSLNGEVFPCRVNDISASGISLWTDQPLSQGLKPTLHIPYLGEFSTETVYLASDRVGLKFLIEEQPQANLVERLKALIRAGQADTGADDTPDTAEAPEAREA
jgi:chromosome partitioning protein